MADDPSNWKHATDALMTQLVITVTPQVDQVALTIDGHQIRLRIARVRELATLLTWAANLVEAESGFAMFLAEQLNMNELTVRTTLNQFKTTRESRRVMRIAEQPLDG